MKSYLLVPSYKYVYRYVQGTVSQHAEVLQVLVLVDCLTSTVYYYGSRRSRRRIGTGTCEKPQSPASKVLVFVS